MARFNPNRMMVDGGGDTVPNNPTLKTQFTPAQLQDIIRRLTSGQRLTPEEAAAVGVSEPSSIKPVVPTVDTKPKWTKVSTINTANGPVDVDANGLAIDGSRPVPADTKPKWTKASSINTANGLVDVDANGLAADGSRPVALKSDEDGSGEKGLKDFLSRNGLTAGPFPKELEQFFGSSAGVLGYKIITNNDGSQQLEVSNSLGSSNTFGFRFKKDNTGKYVKFDSSVPGGDGAGGSTLSTTGQGNTSDSAAIKALQDQITALTKQLTGKTTADTAAAEQKALEERQRKENALTSLTARFSKYGLESLVPKIRELVINGSTESTIAFELQETPEYKQRFKANTERLKKGLAVLDAGTYIGMEDSYRQALRAYGLKQFDTDDYVSQFIANDISANELSNRIVTAVQRVQNADPAITSQLREFYNIGQNDLVAYVLDPNQQFQKIERQVQAAEIGVAAARQGITAGVQVAEQLAAQGVTQAQAQKGYSTIADILPDAKKLSDIYGSTLEGYDLGQAEQEVFNQLASAQRRRQKLTQREIAAFGGSSGTNKTSLTTSSVGQF
jgi:hypothetical protein